MREVTSPIEGEWILPLHPEEKVPGVLRIEDSAIHLTLIGTLPRHWEPAYAITAELILGVTVTGVRITLLRCSFSRSRGSFHGPAVTTLRASAAIWGVHCPTLDDVTAEELWVHYTGLETWVDQSPVSYRKTEQGELLRSLVEFKQVLLSSELMSIEILVQTVVSSAENRFSAHERAYVVFRPPKAYPLDRFFDWIRLFRALLVLATSYQVRVDEVLAQCDIEYATGTHTRKVREALPVLGLTFQSGPTESRPLYPHKLLFSLPDLGEEAQAFVAGWYAKAKSWEPALTLYAFTAYRDDLVLEERFLNSVRACETLHRLEIGGSELSPSRHGERVEEIVASLPAQHKRWLRGKLCFSNELSLRRRMKDLWAECGPGLTRLLPVQRSSFISRAVAGRNYLTHFSQESISAAPEMSELPSLGRWCLIILEFVLLLRCGLSRSKVEDLARRNRELYEDRYLETRNITYRNV